MAPNVVTVLTLHFMGGAHTAFSWGNPLPLLTTVPLGSRTACPQGRQIQPMICFFVVT